MPYRFRGELFGFGGDPTDDEAARVRNHLEAFAADSVILFRSFRTGRGTPLPPLWESEIVYEDPGLIDPPLQDCAITFLAGRGACGALSIYTVGWYRFRGESATFQIGTRTVVVGGRRCNIWHINTRRADGTLENWSRMRGMKG